MLADDIETLGGAAPTNVLVPRWMLPDSVSRKYPGDYWTTVKQVGCREMTRRVQFIPPGGGWVWSKWFDCYYEFRISENDETAYNGVQFAPAGHAKTFQGYSIE